MASFFAVMEATKHGYAILDTGATTSLCGRGCFNKLQKYVGRSIDVDTSVRKRFKFGNGQMETAFGVVKFPWKWYNFSRTVDVHLIEPAAPCLIGIDVLTEIKGVCDLGKNLLKADPARWNDEDKNLKCPKQLVIPLRKIESGHVCIPFFVESCKGSQPTFDLSKGSENRPY